jgi:hypothetical protein
MTTTPADLTPEGVVDGRPTRAGEPIDVGAARGTVLGFTPAGKVCFRTDSGHLAYYHTYPPVHGPGGVHDRSLELETTVPIRAP